MGGGRRGAMAIVAVAALLVGAALWSASDDGGSGADGDSGAPTGAAVGPLVSAGSGAGGPAGSGGADGDGDPIAVVSVGPIGPTLAAGGTNGSDGSSGGTATSRAATDGTGTGPQPPVPGGGGPDPSDLSGLGGIGTNCMAHAASFGHLRTVLSAELAGVLPDEEVAAAGGELTELDRAIGDDAPSGWAIVADRWREAVDRDTDEWDELLAGDAYDDAIRQVSDWFGAGCP